jgi:hypothetical protein
LGEKKVEEKSIDKLIEEELVELRDKSKVIWWDFRFVYYSILFLLKISLTQILCFLNFLSLLKHLSGYQILIVSLITFYNIAYSRS